MSRRTLVGLAAVMAAYVVRYAWSLSIHWINDDFLFLDHVRRLGFLDLWGMNDALGNAYRPVSRNLFFWLGRSLFGTDPTGFHVISMTIALAGVVLCFFVFREILRSYSINDGRDGDGAALLGTLLFAAHPAAGTPISWTCGVQDLLAVTLTFGAMLAHLRGRQVAYPALLVVALLSKETAIAVPILLVAIDWLVRGRTLAATLRAQIPAAVIIVAWAGLNRWLPWHDLGATIHSAEPGTRTLFGRLDWGTVALATRALVLVEPFEEFVWPHGWLVTAALVALQGVALAVALRGPWRPAGAAVLAVGLGWIVLGIAPLITVISRFVYYAYYPSIGLALALVVALSRWPRRPAARLVAAVLLLAVLNLGAGLRYDLAKCDAHNIRRASSYLWTFRSDMLAAQPALPDSSRVYFWNIPIHIGFQLADGPAVRTWYENPTLTGHFLREYVTDASRPAFFFGHDDAGHLFEIELGPRPVPASPPPIYAIAHADIGTRLATAGELEAAIVEWRKALAVSPDMPVVLANMASLLVQHQRFGEAVELMPRAIAQNPDVTELPLYFGFALGQLGRLEEARPWLVRYLEVAQAGDPGREQAMEMLRYIEARNPSPSP